MKILLAHIWVNLTLISRDQDNKHNWEPVVNKVGLNFLFSFFWFDKGLYSSKQREQQFDSFFFQNTSIKVNLPTLNISCTHFVFMTKR